MCYIVISSVPGLETGQLRGLYDSAGYILHRIATRDDDALLSSLRAVNSKQSRENCNNPQAPVRSFYDDRRSDTISVSNVPVKVHLVNSRTSRAQDVRVVRL